METPTKYGDGTPLAPGDSLEDNPQGGGRSFLGDGLDSAGTREDAILRAGTNEDRVSLAIEHLRCARELLKKAGATRTVERVRLALTSAGGAERHARTEPYREARQANRREEPEPTHGSASIWMEG